VPSCYLLTVCSGSTVDRHTNNASLFNLVERVSIARDHNIPPGGAIPLEVHAYWNLSPADLERDLQMRWVMVAETGLETSSPTLRHRPKGRRFKTRTVGVPLPPVAGNYVLHVDSRRDDDDAWDRQPVSWPLSIVEAAGRPRVTH
jgi:hypothetical protein